MNEWGAWTREKLKLFPKFMKGTWVITYNFRFNEGDLEIFYTQKVRKILNNEVFKFKKSIKLPKNDFGKRKLSWVSNSHMGEGAHATLIFIMFRSNPK